jgi:hypothetical protein
MFPVFQLMWLVSRVVSLSSFIDVSYGRPLPSKESVIDFEYAVPYSSENKRQWTYTHR